jgi:hypothetical protein
MINVYILYFYIHRGCEQKRELLSKRSHAYIPM